MISKQTLDKLRSESEKQLRLQVRQLYPHRQQKEMTREEFARQWRQLAEQRFAEIYLDPLVGLDDVLSSSLTVVEFARATEKRRFRFEAGRIQVAFPPGLQRAMKARGRFFQGLFRPLLDLAKVPSPEDQEEVAGPLTLQGEELRKLLLQSAFLRLFTGIEVYLQDTLVRALRDPSVWTRFSENVRDRDIPTHWDDGKVITKYDYARRWADVTTLLLRFPYHEFEGKVSHRYRAAFGFDLKKFKGLNRLVYYRNFRHGLVHRGAARLGIPLVEVAERDLIELARLAVHLADYVESRLPRPK